jgi:hypothetical protein
MSDDEITVRQRASAERAYRDERPDDNPFMEVADRLRDEGKSFEEIHDIMEEAYDAVSEAWGQEMTFLVPEWEVTALVDDPNTPSGKRYKTYTRSAETAEEAERMVEEHTGWSVDSDKTDLQGYAEVA